jgi:hypothetical protein
MIGMALKALQVSILSIYQFISDRPMRIVAIRTFGFALPYGMMGLSQHLRPYPFMTLGTYLGLGGL